MNKLFNKKFSKLILTTSVGFLLSTNLYATRINNDQEDAELNIVMQASLNDYGMYKDEDAAYTAVLNSAIQASLSHDQENPPVQIDKDLQNDRDYLRAVLHSVGVTTEDNYDIEVLKGLILALPDEPVTPQIDENLQDDRDYLRAVLHSVGVTTEDNYDIEVLKRLILALPDEPVTPQIDENLQDDRDYLRAVLHSVGVTTEDDYDIEVLKGLILALPDEPATPQIPATAQVDEDLQNDSQWVNDKGFLRAMLYSVGVTTEDDYDIDMLKGLILALPDEPVTPIIEPLPVRAEYLDNPRSDGILKLLADEMLIIQKNYQQILDLIKAQNPRQFNCQLTTEHIDQIRPDDILIEYFGGHDQYQVVLTQYENEQKALKEYARNVGILSPDENTDQLFSNMFDKYGVLEEVSRRAYKYMMEGDE